MELFKDSKLNNRQRLFCLEYIIDRVGEKAAMRAGYDESNANNTASTLLKRPDVKVEIERLMEEQARRLLITADLILTRILSIADSDPRKLFDADGKLLPINALPEDIAKSISSIEIDEIWDYEETESGRKHKVQVGETKKIKFWDKNRALENLAKHLKLITERHEVTGKDGGPLQLSYFDNLKEEDLNALCDRIIEKRKDRIS